MNKFNLISLATFILFCWLFLFWLPFLIYTFFDLNTAVWSAFVIFSSGIYGFLFFNQD